VGRRAEVKTIDIGNGDIGVCRQWHTMVPIEKNFFFQKLLSQFNRKSFFRIKRLGMGEIG
jgi:hypothetical protein